MRLQFATCMAAAVALLASAPSVNAQNDSQVQAVRQALSGQRFLVTYRDGGAMYGTFYFLDVNFCASGSYATGGRSEKKTALGNYQVSTWTEYGRWDVLSMGGQAVLRSLSTNGKANQMAVRLLPDGRIWIGEGITVKQTGPAACQ